MSEQAAVQTQTAAKPTTTPVAGGVLQRQCACGQHTSAGGECEECKKKHRGPLQRASISSSQEPDVPPIVYEVLRSPGQPLDAATRARMEPSFGYDFSNVRVHTDAKAAESASAVNSLAYTMGRDVVFGTEQYAPQTPAGQKLLAHELAHVIQQASGFVHRTEGIAPAHSSLEHDADSAAEQALNSPMCDNSVFEGNEHVSQMSMTQGLLGHDLEHAAPKTEGIGGHDQHAGKSPLTPSSPIRSGNAPTTIQRQVNLGPNPSTLLGTAWLYLPRSTKSSLVDRLIDIALAAVDEFPGRQLIGDVWIFLKEGLIGFYGKLKAAKEDAKIAAMDKIATIVAGQSQGYNLAFLKGLLKGFFVDGALGIFIAIWDLIKGFKKLWDFLKGIGEAIDGFPEEIQNLIQSFEQFGLELEQKTGPAIEEAKRLFTDPKEAGALTGMIVEKGKAFAKEAGAQVADSLLNFFTKPEADAEIGGAVGSIVGQALWEVVFALVTEGGGLGVTAVKETMKEAARVLGKIFGKVVSGLLKIVEEIRTVFTKVVDVVKSAVKFVKGQLAEIGGKLGELLEKVGEFLGKLLRNCHESKIACNLGKAIGEFHESVLKSADVLRREARAVFLNAYPRMRNRLIEVHHRIPLEWRRLFPKADPNRLSNLQGLTKLEHRRAASDMWDAFRATYARLKRAPTQAEVLEHAALVDRSLNLPPYLP